MKLIKILQATLTAGISIALLGFNSLAFALTPAATLIATPSSQLVNSGNNIAVTVSLNPGGNSVNVVQSVLTYPASSFSVVSVDPGASFSTFMHTQNSSSISFIAGTHNPIIGIKPVTVATFTFKATNTSLITTLLASVCPNKDYSNNCSAVYDSSNNLNDLYSVSGNDIATTTIVVVDQNNNPVSGANVTIASQSAVSNSYGVVNFQNLPTGSQQVTIKTDNKTTTKSVTISGSKDTVQKFTLTANVKTPNSEALLVAVIIIILLALGYIIILGNKRPKDNKKLKSSKTAGGKK